MVVNAVDRKSTFVWCFQNKRALLLAALKGLNRLTNHALPIFSWTLVTI